MVPIKKELMKALQHSASSGERFPDEQYIYQRPVKKNMIIIPFQQELFIVRVRTPWY